MAKKDNTENKEPVGKKPRKKRAKGNFGIFVRQPGDDAEADAGDIIWKELKTGLDSAVACEKHIKANVEEYRGKVLMIAQVKKVGEIEVKTKVTVSF